MFNPLFIRQVVVVFFAMMVATVFAGCSRSESDRMARPIKPLRLVTTTTTVESGLMDVLQPVFERKHNQKIQLSSLGTAAALEAGRVGEADVLLVHGRKAEEEFVKQGYGVNRRDVMYNEFVLVGPVTDPGRVQDESLVLKALQKIARRQLLFVSRGDQSGTHMREMELWQRLGVSPRGHWYLRTQKGMLQTLRLASQQQAYALADLSTFLYNRQELALKVLIQGDRLLVSDYGVIAVNPVKVAGVNYTAAMDFIDFITSREGQKIISEYGTKQFGMPLFVPRNFYWQGRQ